VLKFAVYLYHSLSRPIGHCSHYFDCIAVESQYMFHLRTETGPRNTPVHLDKNSNRSIGSTFHTSISEAYLALDSTHIKGNAVHTVKTACTKRGTDCYGIIKKHHLTNVHTYIHTHTHNSARKSNELRNTSDQLSSNIER
jgi:hypothetical protein